MLSYIALPLQVQHGILVVLVLSLGEMRLAVGVIPCVAARFPGLHAVPILHTHTHTQDIITVNTRYEFEILSKRNDKSFVSTS